MFLLAVVGLEGPLQAIWGFGKLNSRSNRAAAAFSNMFETFNSEGSY